VWSEVIHDPRLSRPGPICEAGWVTGNLVLVREHPQAVETDSRVSWGKACDGVLAVLSFESGTMTAQRSYAATIESSAFGDIIHYDGPAFPGIAGDDNFWGISPPEPPRPAGEARPSITSANMLTQAAGQEKPPFQDRNDRWGLRRLLIEAWVWD
jgi:hypothetical protein